MNAPTKACWNQKFKAECVLRGLTAKKVAEMTGIAKSTIDAYYQGVRRPSDQNKMIFRDVLGIDIEKTFFSDEY